MRLKLIFHDDGDIFKTIVNAESLV